MIFKTVLIYICFFLTLKSNATDLVAQNKDCKKYKDYIEKAKSEWPYSQNVELSLAEREAFIYSYNLQVKDNEKLIADEMMLFPLHDVNEWYVLAGNNGCFVFWLNMEPDKFIELLDGSILSKGKNIWREGFN